MMQEIKVNEFVRRERESKSKPNPWLANVSVELTEVDPSSWTAGGRS